MIRLVIIVLIVLAAACERKPGGVPDWTTDPLECSADEDCVTTRLIPIGFARCCEFCGPAVIAKKHVTQHLEACQHFDSECPVPECAPQSPSRPACVENQCRRVPLEPAAEAEGVDAGDGVDARGNQDRERSTPDAGATQDAPSDAAE